MAELVSKDRPELLDGERLGERQGDEQIVAEPPEKPKARRLHHGGVELVGNRGGSAVSAASGADLRSCQTIRARLVGLSRCLPVVRAEPKAL
jgi:hypothetical protein